MEYTLTAKKRKRSGAWWITYLKPARGSHILFGSVVLGLLQYFTSYDFSLSDPDRPKNSMVLTFFYDEVNKFLDNEENWSAGYMHKLTYPATNYPWYK